MSVHGDSRLEAPESRVRLRAGCIPTVGRRGEAWWYGEVESKVVVQICMQPYMLVLSHAGTRAGSSMADGGLATTALQRWDILVRLYAVSLRYWIHLVYVTMLYHDEDLRHA